MIKGIIYTIMFVDKFNNSFRPLILKCENDFLTLDNFSSSYRYVLASFYLPSSV